MKTMKNFMLFMLAFVSFMMVSCEAGPQQVDPNKPVSENGVLFKFTLPAGVATRSIAAESGENIVNDLTVLFFEPTTNGTGKLVGSYKAPSVQLPGTSQNQFTLEIESMAIPKLVKTDPYSILALANMMTNMFATEAELDAFLSNIEGMTENEVMNYATMSIQGVADNDTNMTGGINNENLPMSAQSEKKASIDVVDVQLIRTLSRFDVANASASHKIISVSVWNAFTQSTVWEKGYMDYSQARTRRFYGRNIPSGQEYIRGGIYAFQNVSTSPDQNDAKTTCLIIGMQENAGGATTYYRVNIHPSESGQYLKRNNVYQLTVQKVSGAGEDSEINAYIKGKVLLDISVNSWDRDEDGLIIRDGDNLLAIPTRKARFSPEAEQRQYYVYTLGTGTLELIKLDMPTGMDAWLGGSTGNDLFISVDKYTFDQRKGSIELRFAGMKGIIEIIQSGATEKSLKLSHTSVPLYPAGKRTDMLGANPILIESSGAWTAEIYGTDFSFDMSNPTENKLRGDNGDHINNIYSNSVNGDPQSRTNFVLITLDEDPDNYRNVLVLTQAGAGGFTLRPNNTAVQFDADMKLSQGAANVNVFTLEPGDVVGDTWSVVMLAGPHADKFLVTITDATSAGAGLWSGNGKITVTAKETNYSGTYSATMRITHNETKTKDITVSQSAYNLTAALLNADVVPETGGEREIRISSTSSQPLAWTATLEGKSAIVTKGLIPYFIGTDGKPIMDGANYATTTTGVTSAVLKIGMMGINQDIRAEGAPTATVTVALTLDPSVKTDITINQDPVKYYNIYGQSTAASYGTWYGTSAYFLLFKNGLQSTSNFGPSGKVYAKTTPNVEEYSYSATVSNNTSDAKKRIFNIPHATPGNSIPWQTFRTDPYVVFVISNHNPDGNNVFNFSGFSGAGFNIINNDFPATTDKKITTDPSSVDTEIYKWLIGGDGPFGAVDVSEFALRSYDGDNAALNTYPSTFIPIIQDKRSSNNYCIMGIDPTLRMIWVGDTEIFGNYHLANNASADAQKFLNNLQAWMIMTNNYGDSFNERFKIK